MNNFLDSEVEKHKDDYTLHLLYGDVFYSRAVKYILKFNDNLVFDEVLNALKYVHDSRLKLHAEILKIIDGKNNLQNILDSKPGLLIGINSLYKNSIILSWSIAPKKMTNIKEINHIYKLVNTMTNLKTFIELEGFLSSLSDYFNLELGLDALQEKKLFMESQLNGNISSLKSDCLEKNFLKAAEKLLG